MTTQQFSTSRIVLKIDALYEAKYYGFALTKGGTNKAMENYSERSVQAVLKSGCRPIKIRIRLTDDRITMCSAQSNQLVGSFSIRDMRCFSRHKDHGPRHKPKFISLMARNSYNNDQTKEYQCYMFHFAKTEVAESFAHMLNYVCQELHRQDVAKQQVLQQQFVPPPQEQQQQQFSPRKPASTSVPTSPQFHVPRAGYNSMPNTPKVNVRRADAPPIKMGWGN
eukprot:m.168664 g.168664  ORF g.168664 m.168664 type:complete len:223 (-) comp16653_c0_seq3:2379-3047(-)